MFMIMIKCNYCNKQWYIDDVDESQITNCTFCGKKLLEYEEILGTETLSKLLYKIVKDSGVDIITSGRLFAYMYDMEPKLQKEIRVFEWGFSKTHLMTLRDLFAQKIEDVHNCLRRLKMNFVEDGISAEWADRVISGCEDAIHYYRGESGVIKRKFTVSTYNNTETITCSACNDNNTERIVNINDGVGCIDTNTSTGAMQQNIHKHYTVEEVLDKYNYESTISDMSRLRRAEDLYIKMCNGQQYNLNISEFCSASDLHVSYGTLTRYTGNSPVVVLPEYIIKIGIDAFSGTNVKALICMGKHMRIEGRYLPQNNKRLAVEVLLCNGLDYVGPNLMENVKCFIINRLFDEQLRNIEVDNLKFFHVNDASNMMSLPPKIASISNKNNYILQINGLDGSKNIS